MGSVKIDEHTIEIITEKPVEQIVNRYDRTAIEQQIIAIERQKEEYIKQRDAEIAECVMILEEMDKLGIISRG